MGGKVKDEVKFQMRILVKHGTNWISLVDGFIGNYNHVKIKDEV